MALPHQVTGNVQKIKFILLDVDGVLTDGRVGLLPDGGEIKYFSIYDGLAIRLRASGYDVLTAEHPDAAINRVLRDQPDLLLGQQLGHFMRVAFHVVSPVPSSILSAFL